MDGPKEEGIGKKIPDDWRFLSWFVREFHPFKNVMLQNVVREGGERQTEKKNNNNKKTTHKNQQNKTGVETKLESVHE